ncbi:hypothetical protein AGOR_G00018170 [Albula goreensis]|uniref:Uncharacterized protein n=1 Tax=Albula goreensis TaxID=1534307 RepID=A0A8T3E0A2_9TELE|nr:hypothetical protein AGOR_G00018170 [Albula goreensis]
MSGVLRGVITTRLAMASRVPTITQRASVYGKPPKANIGVFETTVGLALFFIGHPGSIWMGPGSPRVLQEQRMRRFNFDWISNVTKT